MLRRGSGSQEKAGSGLEVSASRANANEVAVRRVVKIALSE